MYVANNVLKPMNVLKDNSEFIYVYIDEDGEIISYKCKLCVKKLHTENDLNNHLKSSNHCKNVSQQPKQFADLPLIERHCDDPISEAYCLTGSIPRGYQVELFEKSYCSDSIIFLPTGTGKTLISIMIISHMLKCNPKRSVLFVVDKILLALQQNNYIENELKDLKYHRFDPQNTENIIERDLRIICVHGGRSEHAKEPLSTYDVIISTAVYCDLRLKDKVFRWKDFSLVVIDEVHHSDKDHPFSKLLKEEHQSLEKLSRPQILGLTASPAGKDTTIKTILMLQTLTTNLGESKINIVKDEIKELMKYKSSACLDIRTVPFEDQELEIISEFKKYLFACLKLLEENSNLSSSELPSTIDVNFLNEIQENLKSVNHTSAKGKILLNHTQNIVDLIIKALDIGTFSIIEELTSIFDSSTRLDSYEIGPCDKIQSIMNKIKLNSHSNILPQCNYLLKTITELLNHTNILSDIVLIMVKKRNIAVQLCKAMRTSQLIKDKHLSVVSVTGHGAGSSDGMKVNAQKKVFQEIKAGKHQIIIATSVAEEGVDLPKCSLVITLKPPTSIVTLVQMRGRARKNNSKFLVICEDSSKEKKLRDLLAFEKNMERATEDIHNQQRS